MIEDALFCMKMIADIEVCENCKNYDRCDHTLIEENVRYAIEALGKQIPKEPDTEGDGYDNEGDIIYDTWICPNCEEHYEVEYDDYDFCPKCGQAIDKTDILGFDGGAE